MGFRSMIRTFVLGAAAGAAAVYFKDPERGDQRLEEFKEKANSTMSSLGQVTEEAKDLAGQASEQARDLADKAQDKASELKDQAEEKADDEPSTADFGPISGPDAATGDQDSLILPGERRL